MEVAEVTVELREGLRRIETCAVPIDTMAKAQPPKDIDEYIARFPADVRAMLGKVRATIRAAAPEAKETISY